MQTPFSLKIFIADGDPDGFRIAEKSNWIGKALSFPRTLFPSLKSRLEFSQPGVYLLVGPYEEGEGEKLYIGEGDPVLDRLQRHYAEKDFWNRALFFVAGPGQLNKAHVQYLESELIRLARAAKRVTLDNGNNPERSTLSEADTADMVVFLHHMLDMLPVLGIHAFEQAKGFPVAQSQQVSASESKLTTEPVILHCHGKGVEAKGYESTQGFIVLVGSKAVAEATPSMKQHIGGMYDLRQTLIERGVLQTQGHHYVFTQDYVFSAPSTAACIVLGRSANGRTEWKDDKGTTLKELQERESGL